MSPIRKNVPSLFTLHAGAPSRAGPTLWAATALCAAMLLTACSNDGVVGPNDPAGVLRVKVSSNGTSSVIDQTVTEVWVRIDTVQAEHEDEGWIEVADERKDVNLMDSDAFMTIAQGKVWTGAYNRIYIGVVDSWLVVDGAEEDLAFTGNFQATDPLPDGMYVGESYFVVEDATTGLSVTWDLGENLSQGPGGGWTLGSQGTATVDIAE